LKIEETKLKESYYLEFIDAISKNVLEKNPELAITTFAHSRNRLILVASVEVVNKLLKFENHIYQQSKESNYAIEHDKKLTELIIVMRTDMFGKNKKVNNNYPIVGVRGIMYNTKYGEKNE